MAGRPSEGALHSEAVFQDPQHGPWRQSELELRVLRLQAGGTGDRVSREVAPGRGVGGPGL